MTTNGSGKLNMGGVAAIKGITAIPPSEWSAKQADYLGACLTALAHQPRRWYSYQDWGRGVPVAFLAKRGIEFIPVSGPEPLGQSWYDGCECSQTHWKLMKPCPHQGQGFIPEASEV